jgi:hypothetical protein
MYPLYPQNSQKCALCFGFTVLPFLFSLNSHLFLLKIVPLFLDFVTRNWSMRTSKNINSSLPLRFHPFPPKYRTKLPPFPFSPHIFALWAAHSQFPSLASLIKMSEKSGGKMAKWWTKILCPLVRGKRAYSIVAIELLHYPFLWKNGFNGWHWQFGRCANSTSPFWMLFILMTLKMLSFE